MPTPVGKNSQKISAKKILFFSLIVSFLAGSFGGFFFGMVGGMFLKDNLYQKGKSCTGSADKKNIVSVKEEESAAISVVEKVSPSVVSVIVSKDLSKYYNATGPLNVSEEDVYENDPFGFYLPESGEGGLQEIAGGTGFVISADGLILTNKHVVADDKAEYTVVMSDGEKYPAEILGRDPINDIAVLKINAQGLIPVELGDSDKIKIGQTAIAIGNTLSEYRNTVTKGVISGTNRKVTADGDYGQQETLDEAIQTDAAINPGNSGGPLIDISGQVIGINTAVSDFGQLVGFAIPINTAKSVIESVKEHGRIIRPFLGVRYALLNEEIKKTNNFDYDYGALIVRGAGRTDLAVIPGSAADKAGLLENDIILEAEGQKINQDSSLSKILSQYKPGDTVILKISRKGEERDVKVVLDEYKDTK